MASSVGFCMYILYELPFLEIVSFYCGFLRNQGSCFLSHPHTLTPSHTERLAYDWATDKIYWSDYGAAEIGVIDMATRLRVVLLVTGAQQLSRPRALALDPRGR